MDRSFLRNFLVLVGIMVVCASAMGYILISGERTLDRTGEMVVHTYDVIHRAEELSTLVESMLAAQRGYLISANDDFLREYYDKKSQLSEEIATLSELSVDNISQSSRLDEIRHHINVFADRLEDRARSVKTNKDANIQSPPEHIAAINDARINIQRINDAILNEEYGLLRKRISLMEAKKSQYFNALILGGLFGVIMILLFNGFLFQAQSRRNKAETSLSESEQRFALALEGTNDGIFDWDLRAGRVFYSRQFFSMLGYDDKGSFTGTRDDFIMLIHPEDVEAALLYLTRYLNREISEYSQTFRMRGASGYWVWINSRGKAIYDSEGKALRMIGAHTDVTHMKESQERLRQEKDAAEQANRAKSDFLAHMSHEIRTPLTAISGIAEILEKAQDRFDDRQKKLVRTLNTSTSSLKDLINDILDFSKIEGGELELTDANFGLASLFEQVVSIMSVKAQEKKLKFVFDYAPLRDAQFYGDAVRLRQILINLIGNALKFCDQGSVTIEASRVVSNGIDYLQVDVADTGIGIPRDKFDIIFERFKQADSSVARKFGGTGLGLPISKNLAMMMGGDISVVSTLGEGSVFTLRIPFREARRIEAGKAAHDQALADHLTEQIRATAQNEKRVLLVEDYEGNIAVIGYLLDDLGLPYDVARTGVEAISMWSRTHYDLILMDVQMPEMDGLTASSLIRTRESEAKLTRTPIIGMTAHALVADKGKCIAAGMDSYLPKPIVEQDLKTEILRHLDPSASRNVA